MGSRGHPPIPAGGPRIVLNRKAGLTMGLAMGHGEDARAEELHNLRLDNLRLALATFALQLDVFEMRASGALLAAGRATSIAARRASRPRDSEGEKIERQ